MNDSQQPRPSGQKSPADAERDFLEAYDPRQFDRPSVAVDVALLSVDDGALRVQLIRREEHPHRGRWSLPGGFVRLDESLDAAAARVLGQKAGVAQPFIEQLYTFGDPGRDPRTRVISVAYYALVDASRFRRRTAADTRGDAGVGPRAAVGRLDVAWAGETGGPAEVVDDDGAPMPLAFDHADILGMAVKRLRGKLDYTPIGFQLLPGTFTLRRLQQVHETILGQPLNKDSFRRRMLASGQLEATGERESEVGHRPAELYRFVRRSAI